MNVKERCNRSPVTSLNNLCTRDEFVRLPQTHTCTFHTNFVISGLAIHTSYSLYNMFKMSQVLLLSLLLQVQQVVLVVDPSNMRDLFIMEEKLLGLLFPLVRESNETERFVQMALPPHLEVASFGQPGWSKNRVVMERLVGNQEYVFGLVDRLQNILPDMLEQIKDVNHEAFNKIEHIINKHEMPEEESFTKYFSTDADMEFSPHCSNSEISLSAHLCINIPHSIMLSPLKIEIISQNPALFLVHDILTEGQSESLLNSKVYADMVNSNYVDTEEKLIMEQLSQKLEFVEAFKENTEIGAELFEFSGHVPGTHVTPGYLPTVLLFLNNVEGGEVVLPDHSVKIIPVPGSAIIAPVNTDLKYGHCPVTRGVMWLAKHV